MAGGADELGVQPTGRLIRNAASFFGAALLVLFTQELAAAEIPFLDTGVQVYSNVTITSKSATHIFIKHSKGFSGLKVAELSHEALVVLGYEEAPKEQPKAGSKTVAEATEAKTADAGTATGLAKLSESLRGYAHLKEGDPRRPKITQRDDGSMLVEVGDKSVVIDSRVWMVALGVSALLYIFWSACSMAICRKCGVTSFWSGLLCWLGCLRIIPLFRAAGMPRWWLLGMLVPLLNIAVAIILPIVWCIKITNARGKGGFTAMFLLFIPTFPLAFLYLAMSGDKQESEGRSATAPSEKIQLSYQH